MNSPKYKVGALKRKMKVKDDWKPGELISEMNRIKNNNKVPKSGIKQKVAIMGLI